MSDEIHLFLKDMNSINYADKIKALLIDFIEETQFLSDCIYGNEVFYGSKKRQTDLLAINGSTTVFEIKSEKDDFRRAREQMDSYRKVFDYQYLVTTSKQKSKAKSIIKPKEGLITINQNNEFFIEKYAQRISRLNKSEMLETIPDVYLRKYFSSERHKTKSVGLLRKKLRKRPLEELRYTMLLFLKERLGPRNGLFFNEKGLITHYEDLRLLTNRFSTLI